MATQRDAVFGKGEAAGTTAFWMRAGSGRRVENNRKAIMAQAAASFRFAVARGDCLDTPEAFNSFTSGFTLAYVMAQPETPVLVAGTAVA